MPGVGLADTSGHGDDDGLTIPGRLDDRAFPTDDDDAILSRFDRSAEFLSLLGRFLASDCQSSANTPSSSSPQDKDKILLRLRNILDEYQEQSYLLDPHLEAMVTPPVQVLQQAVKSGRDLTSNGQDIYRIARLLYFYTKVRGYKTIVRLFPHEVGDVLPTVEALRRFQLLDDKTSETWELRFILLLWLSLVCMIPFDLQKFSTTMAEEIVAICHNFLESPGKERDAAAITLGKLFQRKDTAHTLLPAFIRWSHQQLYDQDQPSPFLATGVFQTLCEILKDPSPQLVKPHFDQLLSLLSLEVEGQENSASLRRIRSNGLVSKLRSKLVTRMALTLLRPRKNPRLAARRLQSGKAKSALPQEEQEEKEEDSVEIPPSIDDFIAQLLNGLQDKDTLVRYSSAKGLARICERLPNFFIDQVSDAITDLFGLNVLILRDGSEDLSAVSEWTWHGACLGLAELGRRGLLSEEGLGEKLNYVKKALFLDIRRGSYSIGSSVRDAASYILWALSRSYPASSLTLHSLSLAQHLITVTLLDREVAIRRAASAAFQECVGRWGLFPHGIAIIGKTDFFSVGIRRVAFLDALPFVASYNEYRPFLIEALLERTIVHWEVGMRELGAKAVAKVAMLNLSEIVPEVVKKLEKNCTSRDAVVLHGTLLTLTEVGRLCEASGQSDASTLALKSTQRKIFGLLDVVPRTMFRSLGGALVLESACRLIAATASKESVVTDASDVSVPTYDLYIDAALARQEETVHEAASSALEVISSLIDCRKRLEKVLDSLKVWKALSVSEKQSFVLALGSIHFPTEEERLTDEEGRSTLLQRSLRFLLVVVTNKPGNSRYSTHIETRRNAYVSLVSILLRTEEELPTRTNPALVQTILQALVDALADYTTDQRGDVGSWVRLAAMRGLTQLTSRLRELVFKGKIEEGVNHWVPDDLFQSIMGGIAKQMMERIDNLRIEAIEHFLSFYHHTNQVKEFPQPSGRPLVLSTFFPDSPNASSPNASPQAVLNADLLRNPTRLFERLVSLLQIESYRPYLLNGLLQTLSSRTELARRSVGPSLVSFAFTNHDAYSTRAVWKDLVERAEGREAKLVAGALIGLDLLLEDGLIDVLFPEEAEGEAEVLIHAEETQVWQTLFQRALGVASRNLTQIKTHPRLMLSLSLGIALLDVPFTDVQKDVVQRIVVFFLGHTDAVIRRAAAEKLYLILSSSQSLQADDDETVPSSAQEVEELLLEVPWGDDRSFDEEITKVKEGLNKLIDGKKQ